MQNPPGTEGRFPWQQFLHPRFWPTWCGLGILRLLCLLPYSRQLRLGRHLGRLAQKLLKRRVHIAKTNIRLCFPELTQSQQESLLQAHFEAIGMGVFETALSWWGSNQTLLDLADIEGLEHLKKIERSGQGVIMVTGHFTAQELAGHMIGLHKATGAMYRRMKNPLMDLIILRARGHRLAPLFQRDDIRAMSRSLRKGQGIFYAYDQNYGLDHAVFIPFFGVPAATITATSRYATMGRAAVVPFFPRRTKDGRYHITIHPPMEDFPSGDETDDTLRINHLLEQAINQAPEQYFWLHRRFKTRPPGEPSVY